MPSFRRFSLLGLTTALCASACAPEVVTSACTLEKSASISEEPGLRFDALKLLQEDEQSLRALWSDKGGVWSRSLDAAGVPVSPKTRLIERCGGGMDALFLQGSLFLACSRPQTTGEEGDEGELVVYRFDDTNRVTGSLLLGPIGRDGRGAALTSRGRTLELVYHEGQLHQLIVRSASIEPESLKLTHQEVLSASSRVASQPSSFIEGAHHYAIWSESELTNDPKPRSEVWIRRDREAPIKVLQTSAAEAAPSLSHDGQSLILAYRDKKPSDKRNELYVQRLDASLRAKTAATRVGRANGEGPPRLSRCADVHAAVLPREYGGEHYVAVHELTPQLQSLGGGHQYYANTREFVMADSVCSAKALTLLVGERASPALPGIELMTLRFSCR